VLSTPHLLQRRMHTHDSPVNARGLRASRRMFVRQSMRPR
jgi:hypothetical protein